MSTYFTLIIFIVLATLSSGLLGSAALAVCRGNLRVPKLTPVIFGAVLLAVTGALSLTSLGHPEMFLGALGHPGTGIFWELLGSIISIGSAIVFVVLCIRDIEGVALRVFACVAALGAFITVFGAGRSFVMPWRPAWDSWSIVFVFLGCALSCSVNFFLVAEKRFEEKEELPVLFRTVVLIGPITVVAYLLTLAGSNQPEAVEALSRALTGDVSPIFYPMAVFGFLIPSAVAFKRTKTVFPYLAGAILSALSAGAFQYLLLSLDSPAWHFFVR